MVEEQHIKCPQCRKITVCSGQLCADLDLQTDHDFMALLTTIQQPSGDAVANPEPSTSRATTIQQSPAAADANPQLLTSRATTIQQPLAASVENLQPSISRTGPSISSDNFWKPQSTTEASTVGSSIQKSEHEHSRKGKALKKKLKKGRLASPGTELILLQAKTIPQTIPLQIKCRRGSEKGSILSKVKWTPI